MRRYRGQSLCFGKIFISEIYAIWMVEARFVGIEESHKTHLLNDAHMLKLREFRTVVIGH